MVTLELQNNTMVTKSKSKPQTLDLVFNKLFGFALKQTNPNHHPNSSQTNTAYPNKNLIIFKLILKKGFPCTHMYI